MPATIFLTAGETVALLRSGHASATDVVQEHLDHLERHNPTLNAVVTIDAEGALEQAARADAARARGEVLGPLHGVPVTVKDAFATAGLRTTSSFPRLSGHVPERDATTVGLLRAAGAVIVGKTNLPALASDIQTDSPLFGRTNNPWDPARTPGGSTGGGCAAVAAGLSVLELGSDIGGSLRIPAHYCGVYSLKPTEQRVSAVGHVPPVPGTPRSIRHLGTIGPVARSVADLRLALAVLAGPTPDDGSVPPVPLADVPAGPLGGYRIAWTPGGFAGIPVSAGTTAGLESVVRVLAEAGCAVERADPDLDLDEVYRTWGRIFGAELASGMPRPLRALVRAQFALRRDPSRTVRALRGGPSVDMHGYMKAVTARDRLAATFDRFMAGRDAFLCPVTSGPAFTHRRTGRPIEVDGVRVPYSDAAMGHTTVFNVTGSPVVVVPIGRSPEGLPLGVQVVGRRWQDGELLAVAEAVDAAVGAYRRPPGY